MYTHKYHIQNISDTIKTLSKFKTLNYYNDKTALIHGSKTIKKKLYEQYTINSMFYFASLIFRHPCTTV